VGQGVALSCERKKARIEEHWVASGICLAFWSFEMDGVNGDGPFPFCMDLYFSPETFLHVGWLDTIF
jgi:hypothetical protein